MSSPAVKAQSVSVDAARRRVREWLARWVTNPLVRLMAAVGLTPTAVTLMGLAGSAGAAALLATGHTVAGGALVLGGSALDMLDGALARATNTASVFGALLDSTLDRLAEGVILFGLLVHFARRDSTEEVLLVFAAMAAGVLVSYVKARAEGLGLSCNVGVVTRPERIVLLGVGLLASQITPFLYVVAILSFLTAVQRFVHAAGQAHRRQG